MIYYLYMMKYLLTHPTVMWDNLFHVEKHKKPTEKE